MTYPAPMVPELASSRILVMRGRPLYSGDTSIPYKLEFGGGAGWLIGLRCSVVQGGELGDRGSWRSSCGLRVWINEEDELIGDGASSAFALMEDLCPLAAPSLLPLRRRMEPTDNLFVMFKSYYRDGIEEHPSMVPEVAFSFLRDRDFAKVRL